MSDREEVRGQETDLRIALLHQAGERLAASLRARGCLRFPGQVGECEARGVDDNHKCGPCLVLPEWVNAVHRVYEEPAPLEGAGEESERADDNYAAFERLRGKVSAIALIHTESIEGEISWCSECQTNYPCRTVRVLQAPIEDGVPVLTGNFVEMAEQAREWVEKGEADDYAEHPLGGSWE